MSWNTSSPAGTDAISSGDDEIRTFKTDIQTALRSSTTDGLIGSFPGTDAANPVFAYRGARGSTGSRPAASANVGLYHNTTLNTIQRCDGSTYVDVATLIPSGTAMVFYQAAAPTGWTAVAQNDKALRVVSAGGTGGSAGGTTAFSSCWVATATGNESAHTHTVSGETGDGSVTGAGAAFDAGAIFHRHNFSATSGGGSAHSHTVTAYAPQYIDVIVAVKD